MVWVSFIIAVAVEFYQYFDDEKETETGEKEQTNEEIQFIVGAYSLGFLAVNLPSFIVGGNFSGLNGIDKAYWASVSLFVIYGMALGYLVAFNSFSFGKTRQVVLKALNVMIISIIVASLIMYAFSVVLLVIIFLLPQLYHCQSFLYWAPSNSSRRDMRQNLSWVMNNTFFLVWTALAASILLGTILFKS
jgi:hypothetical protein